MRGYEILVLDGLWTATIEVWDAWMQDDMALKFKLVSNRSTSSTEDVEPEAV